MRPGRGDYHASPIEEVTVAAKATDEYGLKGVDAALFGQRRSRELPWICSRKKSEKQADGSTTLSLENFKLVPGDLVSVYATAKDANAEAHTDMMFIQADPFEREFSQSQKSGGGGGGGGGGDQPAQISQREKEIISATFKQQGDKNSTQQQATDIAKLLSQSQATLHDQAVTLSGRLEARELTDEVQAISDFQKDMIAAASAMAPAAQQLQQREVEGRHSERAEGAAIPAARRSHLPANSGCVWSARRRGRRRRRRGARSGRSLRSRTRYREESVRDAEKRGHQRRAREQEIDDALKKLDELAKREEDLAQQQRNGTQTAEQKWQQEMLQREAEQLQQQMEQQLGQNGQQGQQGQKGQQGGQPGGSSSSSGGGSQSSGQDSGVANSQQSDQAAASRQQAAQQALDRLRQANDDMRRAASQNASAADSRRAADRLREATDLLGGLEQQDAAGRLNSMAQTADQLAAQQKQQADHVRDLMASRMPLAPPATAEVSLARGNRQNGQRSPTGGR